MKKIASALVALSVLASLSAAAHATFTGTKNTKQVFQGIEKNSP
jgi:hypothetical protein